MIEFRQQVSLCCCHLSTACREPALELLRLAIPRRVYTDNHIRVIAAACRNIFERRAEITTGYRITFEAPILRHFTVELDKIR